LWYSSFMLTDEQLAITQHRQGHALVRAVPGSGKSTAARHLIARHVREGWTAPEHILTVCFNVDAARDFGVGLTGLLQGVGSGTVPLVVNLHALAYRLLRGLVRQGLAPQRKLVDDTQEDFWRGLVSLALSSAQGVAPGEISPAEIDNYHLWIVQTKARRVGPERPDLDWCLAQGIADPTLFYAVFSAFEEERLQAGVMAFDDLIGDLLDLAIVDERVYDQLSDHYDLLVIDEFQDMTRANLDLLRVLAGERASVIAIGDDDQSIYGFRGADPGIMVREFGTFFPKFVTYTLSGTFRYGPLLCRLSNELIAQNDQRLRKSARAVGGQDTEVHLMFTPDETQTVAEIVAAEQARQPDASMGILVRAYHQSVLSEISLLYAGIPYRIEGAPPFFDRQDAQALAGYLALATGALDEHRDLLPAERAGALARALLLAPHRYLRQDDLDRAAAWVSSGRPFRTWVWDRCQVAMEASGGYSQRLGGQLANLLRDIQHLSRIPLDSGGDFIRSFYSYLGLRQEIGQQGAVRGTERTAAYRVLADFADRRGFSVAELQDYLTRLSSRYAEAQRRRRRPTVVITSWHKTKGGEFDAVILPDLRAGKSPYICGDLEVDFAEERRLFFVAMTRAKAALYLLAPEDARLYATIAGLPLPPMAEDGQRASPFLSDIANWEGVRIWAEPAFLDVAQSVSP
jgi:DNA helicase-2/ATP-dependent DNA helicase PcrA